MELIEIIVILIINLLSFVIGAKIGQNISHNKEITINPIKAVKEEIEDKRIKHEIDEQERLQNIELENIDNYNGDSLGQKEVK